MVLMHEQLLARLKLLDRWPRRFWYKFIIVSLATKQVQILATNHHHHAWQLVSLLVCLVFCFEHDDQISPHDISQHKGNCSYSFMKAFLILSWAFNIHFMMQHLGFYFSLSFKCVISASCCRMGKFKLFGDGLLTLTRLMSSIWAYVLFFEFLNIKLPDVLLSQRQTHLLIINYLVHIISTAWLLII